MIGDENESDGQKIKSRLSWIYELLFIFLCLLGFLAGVVLYNKDYYSSIRVLGEEPIGYVTNRENVSQRQKSNRALWERMDRDTAVYNGDNIITGDFSETDIILSDKGILRICENSSIVFHNSGESISLIELKKGALSVQAGGFSLTVFSGINRFELKPESKGEFRISGNSGLIVSVFQGNGFLSNDDGGYHQVNAGESLFVNADGIISRDPMVLVVSPQPGKHIFNLNDENAQVRFDWRKVNFSEDERVYLDLAGDREFRRPLVTVNQENGTDTAIDLPPGTYYWRAYADTPGVNASFGKFSVIQARPPRIDYPLHDQVFLYRDTIPTVCFLWSVPAEADSITLEVSNNYFMENLKIEKRFQLGWSGEENGAFYSRELDEGIWYWRIKAEYTNNGKTMILLSEVRSFMISRERGFDSPRLVHPKQGDTLGIGPGQEVFFSWESGQPADSYTILVSVDENLRNPIIEEEVHHNYYVYKHEEDLLKNDTYYWAVYRTDAGGNNSPLVHIGSFHARTTNPGYNLMYPPDNFITSSAISSDLVYTWESPFPHSTVFQISKRSDFADEMVLEKKLTNLSNQGWFLPPGIYYWRVATEIQNHSLRFISPPKRLTILPSFSAPDAITPGDGETLMITEGVPVDFRWARQNYADMYEFKLFFDGNDTPLYEVSYLRDTIVQVYFSSRTAGRFHWIVHAYTDSINEITRKRSLIRANSFSVGSSDASPLAGFVRGVVQAGEVRTPITLTAPRSGVTLRNDSSSPPVISWSTDEFLQNTRVIFSRLNDPSHDQRAIVQFVEQDITSINLPALSEGVWYWIVEGETLGGHGISAAAPSFFTLLPPLPYPAPVYLQPYANQLFTLAQITVDRRINFLWEEVPGANAYIFSLFGQTDRQELLLTSASSPDTSYVLTDLTLLTANNYTWQVEAVSVARNGIIEKRGMIQKYSFTIDSNSTSEPLRTRAPGTVYGD